MPSDVIKEFSTLLKMYGIHEVHGDNFAGGYEDEWRRNGIRFIPSEYTTSENYIRALPIILSKRARFVDNSTLRTQLVSLERTVTSGREKVDHPKHGGAHDDVCASVCGMLVIAGDRLGFSLEQMLKNERPPEQQKQQQQSYAARNFEAYVRQCVGGVDPRNPWGRGGVDWSRLPRGNDPFR